MTRHFDYYPRWCSADNWSVGSSAPVVSRWLWNGNRTFLKVASMVVSWWIVTFLSSARTWKKFYLLSCHTPIEARSFNLWDTVADAYTQQGPCIVTLSTTDRTPIVIQLYLRSQIGLWEKYYYAPVFDITQLVFFWCWVYKYCCLVYRTVWCGDKVWSANCARKMCTATDTLQCHKINLRWIWTQTHGTGVFSDFTLKLSAKGNCHCPGFDC